MAWKILDSFIVHHASQKKHGYAKLWGASSSTWPCLGKGVGGDDLQRFPPTTAIPGFCGCYGVPYFFVKIKINNNSSIDLNTLNDLQISKVKKVVRKSFIPPHTSFIRLYSRMHVYNMQYVHLWKIYTIYAYTYTYHIYEYMRLVKRRENTALFENPYWPLRSYQHLGFLTQVFAMEGIITLKGIADIFLTKRNSKQFPYSSIN